MGKLISKLVHLSSTFFTPSPPSDRKSTALRPATSRDTGSRTDIYTHQDGTRKPGRDGNVDTFLAHSTPMDLTKSSSSSTTQLDESLLRNKTNKDVELQTDPVKYDLVAQVKSSVQNEQLSHIERKARLNEAWIMVRKFKKLSLAYELRKNSFFYVWRGGARAVLVF